MRTILVAMVLVACETPAAHEWPDAGHAVPAACETDGQPPVCPAHYTLACVTQESAYGAAWRNDGTGCYIDSNPPAYYGPGLAAAQPEMCGTALERTCNTASGAPWQMVCVPDEVAIGCPARGDGGV